ncbi:MAG: tyrosine-protein phosphatase [Acidobacteriia bacterium]|nr:tyrosine-protein phosphatase [Terriglobia bacterium]
MSFRIRRVIGLFVMGLPAWAASSPAPGISRFDAVDQQVYRGAQPTGEGISYLSKLGIKVVLDLREHDERSLLEERLVTAAGMRYVNVPMTGKTPPTPAETNTILSLLEDPAAGPVFVHCKRGVDRTGAVIAAYRIDHDKWDNARALKEAKANGMSPLQFQRQKYIRTFQAQDTDRSGGR